jgi:hypothetical protein
MPLPASMQMSPGNAGAAPPAAGDDDAVVHAPHRGVTCRDNPPAMMRRDHRDSSFRMVSGRFAYPDWLGRPNDGLLLFALPSHGSTASDLRSHLKRRLSATSATSTSAAIQAFHHASQPAGCPHGRFLSPSRMQVTPACP